ncbi:class I SAM-dependent methyltransferase [Pseudaestuariivita rosea]|uniref:class I SAM-dependent methyltransferase n=1 Tax=Pseudaestuariivita rosea TaxID=2763263 RepID=UPI001ABBAE96|nr:class I SAM-dependent methyltransferase [Pseudaestuariivita rosea]
MRLFRRTPPKKTPFSSGSYWNKRYISGQNSGAGSYGKLAEYKAQVINDLVKEKSINSVIEFGCGDGNQASLFDFSNYTGLDISRKVVKQNRKRFSDREKWQFHLTKTFKNKRQYDLSMSLDVIYHLIEDDTFDDYMQKLFDSSGKYVLIYASDHDATTDSIHVKHRHYSGWIEKNRSNFNCIQTWKQPYPLTENSDPDQTTFAFFRLFESSDP